MNLYVQRLLSHIPDGVPKDPQNVPCLVIFGTGTVVLEGSSLYISENGSTGRIDLHGKSVSQVVQAMPPGVDAFYEIDGMAELLSIPNGGVSATLPTELELAQSGLYMVLGAGARILESRRRSLTNQVMQMDLQSARGAILDWWGATLDVPRISGEPDLLYAQRIAGLRFEPNVNNYAMVDFFAKLGYDATVTDTAYGEFEIRVTLPSEGDRSQGTTTFVYSAQGASSGPQNGFVYSLSDVEDAINILKAIGTIVNVFVDGTLSDTIVISDTVSETLAPAAWTVGNVTIGEFIV